MLWKKTTEGPAEVTITVKDINEASTNNHTDKALRMSEKYSELESCCSIISSIKRGNIDDSFFAISHNAGWRFMAYHLESAGINVEKIYDFIEGLVVSRKKEIEAEIEKLV